MLTISLFSQTQAFAVADKYCNNLLKIDFEKLSDNAIDINIYTTNKYPISIKPVKRSDNEYAIILPDTFHSITSLPQKIGVEGLLKSIDIKLFPYMDTEANNGYTKITLKTFNDVSLSVDNIIVSTIPIDNKIEKIIAEKEKEEIKKKVVIEPTPVKVVVEKTKKIAVKKTKKYIKPKKITTKKIAYKKPINTSKPIKKQIQKVASASITEKPLNKEIKEDTKKAPVEEIKTTAENNQKPLLTDKELQKQALKQQVQKYLNKTEILAKQLFDKIPGLPPSIGAFIESHGGYKILPLALVILLIILLSTSKRRKKESLPAQNTNEQPEEKIENNIEENTESPFARLINENQQKTAQPVQEESQNFAPIEEISDDSDDFMVNDEEIDIEDNFIDIDDNTEDFNEDNELDIEDFDDTIEPQNEEIQEEFFIEETDDNENYVEYNDSFEEEANEELFTIEQEPQPLQDNSNNEPTVLLDRDIEENKKLYLIELDGEQTLIGNINEAVFVIHKFNSPIEGQKIATKLNEEKTDENIYLTQIGNWRALIGISENDMKLKLEL